MPVARRLIVTMLLAVLASFLAPAVAQAAPSAGPVKYYVVRSDYSGQPEFLFEIAQRFLGSGDRNTEIFALNKGRMQPDGLQMTKPEAILPGWVLQLPADAKGDGVETGLLPTYAAPVKAVPAAPKPAASTHGPGWLPLSLLIAGGLILVAVVGLGYWLWRRNELPPLPRLWRRRRMPPPFVPGRPAVENPADSDRFFSAGEEQTPPSRRSQRAHADRDRVPAVALAGAAIVAVGALAVGTVFAITGTRDAEAATTVHTATALSAPITDLGPRIGTGDPTLCLAATTTNDGSPLIVKPCDGGLTQQWQVATDGTIRTAERCMDVAGAARIVGTVVQLATCNGNPAQQFAFDGAKLVSELTGNCVDVSGGKVTAGAGVVIATCASVGNRLWKQLP
jgi:Ricin-type beta-trefoil lectin domain